MPKKVAIASAALVLSACVPAQQPSEIGIAPALAADERYLFATAEVDSVSVSVVAQDFPRSFAMEFLPDGNLLLAERGGNLRVVRDADTSPAQLDPEPIVGMPLPGTAQGNFGLHDIALHPDFAGNGLVYWTWNIPVTNAEKPDEPPEQGRFAIMRGRLSGHALHDVETIFEADTPSYPAGTRLAFGQDGMLYATTGAPFGPAAQDLSSPYGKVLRLQENGAVPPDNPFAGRDGAHPAIYSYGHRDQHGLAMHPAGQIFTIEHGPNGGDELNLIRPGANYGWPEYTLGRNYDGTAMDVPMQGEGITDPLVVWLPSIAPSALMIYSGEAFPAWQGNFFVASARRGEIDRTGGLERVVFNSEYGELRRETLLSDLRQRIRDVQQGPGGLIYVLLDGPENAVLRIAPDR